MPRVLKCAFVLKRHRSLLTNLTGRKIRRYLTRRETRNELGGEHYDMEWSDTAIVRSGCWKQRCVEKGCNQNPNLEKTPWQKDGFIYIFPFIVSHIQHFSFTLTQFLNIILINPTQHPVPWTLNPFFLCEAIISTLKPNFREQGLSMLCRSIPFLYRS